MNRLKLTKKNTKSKKNRKGGGRLSKFTKKIKTKLNKINPFRKKKYNIQHFRGNNNNSTTPSVPPGFSNINFSEYEPKNPINMHNLPPPPPGFRNNNNNSSSLPPPPPPLNSKKYNLTQKVLVLKSNKSSIKNNSSDEIIHFCNETKNKIYKINIRDVEAVMPYNKALAGISETEIETIIKNKNTTAEDINQERFKKEFDCDFVFDNDDKMYKSSGFV